MICINEYIRVRFDKYDKQVFKLGELELVKPLEWASRDKYGEIKLDDNGCTKFEENVNYLETKPQICEVLAANERYPYRSGDKLFVHYMAWESAKSGDIVTYEAFILASFVILTILPTGEYKMAKDTYLAEQVLTDDEVTPSGIIVNAFGRRPKACQLKLLHLHDKSKHELNDIVVTVDNYQYPCEIDGKKYIMVRDREIVAKVKDGKLIPIP